MFYLISIGILLLVVALIVAAVVKQIKSHNYSSCTGECLQGRNCNCELAEDQDDIQQDQRT